MAEMEKTMIDNDGFGGMTTLAGGAGFVEGLVLGSLWNGWNGNNRTKHCRFRGDWTYYYFTQ